MWWLSDCNRTLSQKARHPSRESTRSCSAPIDLRAARNPARMCAWSPAFRKRCTCQIRQLRAVCAFTCACKSRVTSYLAGVELGLERGDKVCNEGALRAGAAHRDDEAPRPPSVRARDACVTVDADVVDELPSHSNQLKTMWSSDRSRDMIMLAVMPASGSSGRRGRAQTRARPCVGASGSWTGPAPADRHVTTTPVGPHNHGLITLLDRSLRAR